MLCQNMLHFVVRLFFVATEQTNTRTQPAPPGREWCSSRLRITIMMTQIGYVFCVCVFVSRAYWVCTPCPVPRAPCQTVKSYAALFSGWSFFFIVVSFAFSKQQPKMSGHLEAGYRTHGMSGLSSFSLFFAHVILFALLQNICYAARLCICSTICLLCGYIGCLSMQQILAEMLYLDLFSFPK